MTLNILIINYFICSSDSHKRKREEHYRKQVLKEKAIHKKLVAITSSIMEDDQTSDTSASESKSTSF